MLRIWISEAMRRTYLRLVPCNVMLSSRVFKPPIDLQAEESIEWTAEGKERLKKIPGFVRPMATSAILRYALERGHSMITSGVITEAVQEILACWCHAGYVCYW